MLHGLDAGEEGGVVGGVGDVGEHILFVFAYQLQLRQKETHIERQGQQCAFPSDIIIA